MQSEMNRLFSGFSATATRDFPPINIWLGENSVVVTAELPGVTHDDVNLSLQEDVLTLAGKREPETQEQNLSWQRRERAYGTFSRAVQLPFRVDPEKVQARFNNAFWKSSCSGWKRIGRRRSRSVLRDLNGGSAIMAQEVRTVEQQTPTSQRVPPRPVFLPPTDIYETKESIVVLAEMPGVPPDGLDISLERRVLTIRGRSAANEHGGYQRVYNEYAGGDYERVFTLSENIDRDRIEAALKDGILQLVLPKAEAARARKIELKAS